MSLRVLWLVPFLLSCCTLSRNRTETISGNNLIVFAKVDVYSIPHDEESEEFDQAVYDEIEKRALFLLSAHAENKINSKESAERYRVLLANGIKRPDVLDHYDDTGFIYVWARYDITEFIKILNEDK